MTKAIRTHFVGPSDVKGARFIADDGDGNRVTVPYDYARSSEENHRKAAYALSRKMKWSTDLIGGSYKNDMVWVEPSRYETTKWEIVGEATSGAAIYVLFRRFLDGVPLYNVERLNQGAPSDNDGGYPNLFSMLKLKGLESVKKV